MAIKLTDNAIRIGNYILSEVSDGINFTGVLKADKFSKAGFQGQVSGYASGGFGSGTQQNVIDKYPFATTANATDVGDLTAGRYNLNTGQSSTSFGYQSGGGPVNGTASNIIDKFPFATDTNAVDSGDLSIPKAGVTGQSSSSSGYNSGGTTPTPPGATKTAVIDKFPFSADSNSTDIGDLTQSRWGASGQSSLTHGYAASGVNPGPPPISTNVIDKFPFSVDTNATDVGDLAVACIAAGLSSQTHGYSAGEGNIQKFPFSSDSNATDIGDTISAPTAYQTAGASYVSHGFFAGGYTPGSGAINRIERFSFITDGNSVDLADLTVSRYSPGGNQK